MRASSCRERGNAHTLACIFRYLYATNTDSQLVGTWRYGEVESAEWVFNDGSVFRGEFQGSCPKGKGAFAFPDGNVQLGSFKPRIRPQVRCSSRGPKIAHTAARRSFSPSPFHQ